MIVSVATLMALIGSIPVKKSTYPPSIRLNEVFHGGYIGPIRINLGGLAQNDDISGIEIWGLFSMLSFSSIDILKTPNIRNTSVQALAWAILQKLPQQSCSGD